MENQSHNINIEESIQEHQQLLGFSHFKIHLKIFVLFLFTRTFQFIALLMAIQFQSQAYIWVAFQGFIIITQAILQNLIYRRFKYDKEYSNYSMGINLSESLFYVVLGFAIKFQFYLATSLLFIAISTYLIIVQRYKQVIKGEFLKIVFSLTVMYHLIMNIQIMIIVIRVDDLINWNYDQVLFISWILLTILTGSVLLQILSFISLIQKLFFCRHSQLSKKHKIVQFSIFLTFQVSSICLLIFSTDLMLSTQRLFELQFNNWVPFKIAVLKMLGWVFFNGIFLLAIRKTLYRYYMDFASQFEMIQYQIQNESSPVNQNITQQKRQQRTVNIAEIPDFVKKLSSTYFQYKKQGSNETLNNTQQNENQSTCRIPQEKVKLQDNVTVTNNSVVSFNNRQNQLNETQYICQVCFTMEADCVFMECGHGGICLSCAQDILSAQKECYLCRQFVDYIVRYDNKTWKDKEFKVVEVYQKNKEKQIKI